MIWLLSLLIIKAFLAVAFQLYGNIYLAPDEAQYWLWSQFLDVGYYSKPPGIAYEIALGTYFWGNNELGVRFIGIIFSFFLGLSTYFLARSADLDQKKSRYAALILSFCPMGLLSSFAATTDSGFVLAWIWSFTLLALSLKNQKPPSFYILGLVIAFGALFKWTIYIIWLPIIFGLITYPSWRSKKMIGGFFCSLLALLPSLYWNLSHDFVTIKHVASQTINKAGPNGVEFIIAQMLLFFPPFFAGFLYSLTKLPSLSSPLRFTVLWGFLFLLAYVAMAFFQKMQVNWIVYCYPLLAVAAAYSLSDKWLTRSLVSSSALSLLIFAIPYFNQQTSIVPYSINPFKPSMGLNRLAEALANKGYDPNQSVLIADRYQTSALLSFYSEGKKRAYLLNLLNLRKNQFFFWPQLEKGASGYFVLIENRDLNQKDRIAKSYQEKLVPYFDKVSSLGVEPLFDSPDKILKWVLIFKVEGYNGQFIDHAQAF